MLYAVLFEDDPAKTGERRRHMPAHLAFLEREADRIRAAGPLLDGEAGAGGLWLVEADPFWPTGLRRSVRILAWRQVFSDGRRVG